jgi:DNA-binding PadR family transcriptional regulator
MAEISTTGYLILGVLALRDTSAYDLVEQFGKGVAELWPRADRHLYHVPKKLVELGLITSRSETSAGRRKRTVYSITPAGRAALAEWEGTRIQPSAMEFEGMVRLLLADQGKLDDLRATLRTMIEQAGARRDLFAAHARYALDTDGGTEPERVHVFALVNRYMIQHFDLEVEWASWALEQIADWPDTVGPATDRREQAWRTYRENIELARVSRQASPYSSPPA